MLRLYNARIMPMLSPGDCSILNGELWTDGERISYVGCARQDAPHFERELDLGGRLALAVLYFKLCHLSVLLGMTLG